MGRITAKIKVQNLGDVLLAEEGKLEPGRIRTVETEAIVDTGATLLCLPAKIISKLGLSFLVTRRATTATGPVERRVFQGARLTILNRTCSLDVMELENDIPPLIGYIPLENLDLRPDPQRRTLGPNPEHGDRMIVDLFLVFARALDSIP